MSSSPGSSCVFLIPLRFDDNPSPTKKPRERIFHRRPLRMSWLPAFLADVKIVYISAISPFFCLKSNNIRKVELRERSERDRPNGLDEVRDEARDKTIGRFGCLRQLEVPGFRASGFRKTDGLDDGSYTGPDRLDA